MKTKRRLPTVYFRHPFQHRSVIGCLLVLGFPGVFAVVATAGWLFTFGVLSSLALSMVGIDIWGVGTTALMRVVPSVIPFIAVSIVFTWFTYQMGTTGLQRFLHSKETDVFITSLGIQIGKTLYHWDDVSWIGCVHILPRFLVLAKFGWGDRHIWIPTNSFVRWRKHLGLVELLNSELRVRYPHVRFGASPLSLGLYIPTELLCETTC